MAISKLILNGETQMDVTSNTNTSNNMLSGVVGTKNDGTSVTGSIATKTSSDLTASGATVTAPAGYYANAASKAVSTTTHPNPTASIVSSTGVVTASHTQGTGYVTSGTTTGTLSLTTQAGKTITPTETAQTAVASYRWTTGPISVAAIDSYYIGSRVPQNSAADVTIANTTGVVTAPAGYYSTAATKTLTTKARETFYPSTADQTISSYRWLIGNQTIASVTTTNLVAQNIAEGVVVKVGDANNASRITQVTGTYSSNDFVITASKNNQGDLVIDKTYNEVMSAYGAGKDILIESTDYGSCTIFVDDDPNYPAIYINTYDYINEGGMPIIINLVEWVFDSNNVQYIAGSFQLYEPLGANAVPSDVTSGKVFYNANGRQVGTNSGGGGGSDTEDALVQRTISVYENGRVSQVGDYAFEGCSLLTTASFPNATSIGINAFYGCASLTTISFPNVISIGRNAFFSCSGLTTVDFPKVTDIGSSAFSNCTSLTTISFPNAQRMGVNAFNFCRMLTEAVFPKVSYIPQSAFYSCSALTTISFPSAKSIHSYAFYNCYSLITATFPSVTSMSAYVFTYCSSLTTVDFPKATIIDTSAFAYCSRLTTTSFPSAQSIGSSAFYGCYNLATVSFPRATNIYAYAFSGCFNLLSVYLLGSSLVTLKATNAFMNTPISNYTTSTGGVYGSIFVPSSLYNSYITATNWSVYSSRFVSV